ncbi:hypothetical protein B0O99DRAFT_392445 [Bisporella sp. PMI_857]|nr:hypothetical protein B0O99DRAFT_392445 [Bisporella sp. PMI_857]
MDLPGHSLRPLIPKITSNLRQDIRTTRSSTLSTPRPKSTPVKKVIRFRHKQTRERTTTSKSGCKTCKKRHIKCDETHPACINCSTSGWICDFPPIVSTTNLAPRPARPPPQPFQVNMEDGNYLQYAGAFFFDQFASPFESSCVDSAQLFQSVQAEPCIRHIVLGMAMMHHISRGMASDRRKELYNNGLQHYAQSVKVLQKVLDDANGQGSILAWDISLLASHLFVSFESLSGNVAGAYWHLQNGFMLIKTALQEYGTKMKIPSTLEETAYSFNRMDTLGSTTSALYETQALLSPDVPHAFDSMTHAKRNIEAIVPNILRLIRRHLQYDPRPQLNLPISYAFPDDIPKTVVKRWAELKAKLQSWLDAFNDLIPRISPLDTRRQIALHTLMILYWHCFLWLGTAFASVQTAFDSYLAVFDTITSLGEKVVAMQPERQKKWYFFTADVPFIQPLFYVAQKCRDGKIRRRAVKVLKLAGSEPVLEGESMAAIGEWIIKTEEEGLPLGLVGCSDRLSEGFIEERWRLRGANISIDPVGKKFDVSCVRVGENGAEEEVNGSVTWGRADSGQVVHREVDKLRQEAQLFG